MKNKQLSYILIPLVLVIWGLIVYKIINQVNHGKDKSMGTLPFTKAVRSSSVSDTLSLVLYYRDPFLHGMIRPVSGSISSNDLLSNKGSLTIATTATVNFPGTRYFGFVVNSKNKQKLGLFKIDNKDYLAKEGELIGGEKIAKLYTDSVIIICNKTKKTFFKNRAN